jgi:hypothetical protein
MTRTFEIFYHDLNEDCKRRFLEFNKVSDPDEMNADISPIYTVELEDMPEEEVA